MKKRRLSRVHTNLDCVYESHVSYHARHRQYDQAAEVTRGDVHTWRYLGRSLEPQSDYLSSVAFIYPVFHVVLHCSAFLTIYYVCNWKKSDMRWRSFCPHVRSSSYTTARSNSHHCPRGWIIICGGLSHSKNWPSFGVSPIANVHACPGWQVMAHQVQVDCCASVQADNRRIMLLLNVATCYNVWILWSVCKIQS